MRTARKKRHHSLDEYVVEVEKGDDGEYVLTVPLLPGCMAAAHALDEAYEELKLAFQDWADDVEAHGGAMPRPTRDAEYSGRTVLRMPRGLHARVAREAEREGVSLNSLLVSYVSHGLGSAESGGWTQLQLDVLKRVMSDLRSEKMETGQPEGYSPDWRVDLAGVSAPEFTSEHIVWYELRSQAQYRMPPSGAREKVTSCAETKC